MDLQGVAGTGAEALDLAGDGDGRDWAGLLQPDAAGDVIVGKVHLGNCRKVMHIKF